MEEKILSTRIQVCTPEELDARYRNLLDQAKEAAASAYAPYSGFHVGTAVLLENGEVFSGSNQENSAYPSGLCAERVALFFANAQRPQLAPEAIAIAASAQGRFLENPITPCGACRQALLESEMRFRKNIKVLLYGSDRVYVIECIKDLLPLCFGKDSLV